jgi:hypothetical protein
LADQALREAAAALLIIDKKWSTGLCMHQQQRQQLGVAAVQAASTALLLVMRDANHEPYKTTHQHAQVDG